MVEFAYVVFKHDRARVRPQGLFIAVISMARTSIAWCLTRGDRIPSGALSAFFLEICDESD